MAWDTVSILVTIAIGGIALFIFYNALKRPIDLMLATLGGFFGWLFSSISESFKDETVTGRAINYE